MDEGALTTQRGRTVYKPLAKWRGEKAVFARRDSIETLGTLQEIIRTEGMPPPRPKIRAVSRGRPQSMEAGPEKEDGEPLAEWELNDGSQLANIMAWDIETQKYNEECTEEVGMLHSLTMSPTLLILHQ